MDVNKRSLLLGGLALGGLAAADGRSETKPRPGAAAGSMFSFAAPPLSRVRVGVIGVGERGTPMTDLLLSIDGVDVVAICDTDAVVLDRAVASVTRKTGKAPARITGDVYAFRRLCDRADLDVIFVFTPWQWHAPMALAAMHAGKHVFCEVPLATTTDDLWALVEASESTRRHCMMMENCCYGREEMMVLSMVRQHLFGELLHAQAAYLHELKQQLASPVRGEGVWRPAWQARHRGNLYPTHGLGPVAQYLDINRGDRFDYVVSMDSPALGMGLYAQRKLAPADPRRSWKFVAGDINSSLIRTVKGRTILVQHDIDSPRPYDRLNYIQGTNGAFGGYPPRIAVDEGGLSDNHHEWDHDLAKYQQRYDHPLWRKLDAEAKSRGGHGGMDFVMLWRIIACLRNGLPVDQPVYDGATWSVLFDLSDRSVRNKSAPQDFPDFTRGAWRTTQSFDIAV